MTYGGFSVPFANKIADIIDAVETGDQYLAESDFRVSQTNTYYVVLDEDLAAPDDKSTPTTAVATVYKPGADGTVGEDGYSSTPHKLDVVNRFTGYSASEGDFIVVEEQDGEYRPSGAGGGGGGGGGCACDCVVVNPNLFHWGNFPTVFEWQVSISNTTPLELVTAGNGWVRLTSGDYTVLWNEVQGKWSNGNITASLEFFDSDLDAVTPSSATGTLTVEWESSSGDFIALFEFDGVIP
jgi:hypothetical protein